MADLITIGIIDSDENSRRFLKTMLSEIPWVKIETEANDLNRGYELIRKIQPSIVILDLGSNVDHALVLAEKISQNLPKTTLFVTSANTSSEVVIRAMRSGAREFLSKPLNRDEVSSAVKSVIRLKNSQMMGNGSMGKVITAFGVKGGVGTTTIATNLAVNLSRLTKKEVVLIDLNLQLGNAALFMDIKSKQSIVDIINNIDDLNPKLLKDILPRHSSGIYVLSSSSKMEDADRVRTIHLDKMLTLLKTTFDYIVIDGNDIFDDLTLKVLDESDSILAISTVDLPAVYNTRQCLDIFQRMGYGQDKVRLVFNRYASIKEAAFQELEKSLDYPIYWKIPNQDYATVVKSINEGTPVSIMKPNSKLSQSFHKLAIQFNGRKPETSKQKNRKLKKSRIKTLFTKKDRR
jgi:pilus assembly protein CpaE